MGGPLRSIRMQRAPSGSFWTPSWGPPRLLRAAARSAARRCPSADKGGSLPSGGSTLAEDGHSRQPRDRGGNDETAHQHEKSMVHLESPIHLITASASYGNARRSILRRIPRT